MISYSTAVAQKLNLPESQVSVVLQLLSEACTIPFIARYRKDKTGALDEVQIQSIRDEAQAQKEFCDRKDFIVKTITEQGKMDDALQKKIDQASSLSQLEDIYLPYKPKRKTKAQMARENGLEPLANWLLLQQDGDCLEEAKAYIQDNVADAEAALQGARDIIAEGINEDAELREGMRHLFEKQAQVHSKVLPGKEEEAAKYKDYFAFSEPVTKIPSHRLLAVMRGFMEGYLRMSIAPEEEKALDLLVAKVIKADNEAAQQVSKATKDAYRRLLQPSLESELRMALKTAADEEAISVFAENLRQLLLSAPLGSQRVLAIDPGYRTGCKVVVLDENGELLATDLIYVHEKNYRLTEASQKLKALIDQYQIAAFAIGDGTAGRETEQFVKSLDSHLPVFLVNEDGASIYSASGIAREEFPDYDITVRGAVSIGRRLMDPLAELVKIDPKSIGVGQYQHDVNQLRLKEKLDQTIESCVNKVGVNLNTASKYLLSYVSGIGPSLAENIIQYRRSQGKFTNRKQLLEVPRLGQKAFEQCAGFLRIKGGDHPLDESSVHPEAYPIVEKMAKGLGKVIQEVIGNDTLAKEIQPQEYVTETTGLHSLQDILTELKKPGLDPRSAAQAFEFAAIYDIEEVRVGMLVPGMVTNLTRFGAFVDIGIKQDGLVHVSEIAHRYISDPSEVLKLNDKVMVKVTEVDVPRRRIALSIKQAQTEGAAQKPRKKEANSNFTKPKQNTGNSMDDALSQLKQRFKN